MTFRRLFGLGVGIIIYGVCAVGWADVKPVDPATACLKFYDSSSQSLKDVATYLLQYKVNGTLTDGRYVVCFKQNSPLEIKNSLTFQTNAGDSIVIYGLQLTNAVGNTMGFPFLSISGTNVLLQNIQLTGPGSNIAGSTGLSLTGSNLSVITSTITGFETGIRADCAASTSASPSPQPSPEGEGVANCTIGPQNVMENVQQGVVLPTTSQGVTITRNDIRTVNDPNGTARKIVLQGSANATLKPPALITDPATSTIWKTLSAENIRKKWILNISDQICRREPWI